MEQDAYENALKEVEKQCIELGLDFQQGKIEFDLLWNGHKNLQRIIDTFNEDKVYDNVAVNIFFGMIASVQILIRSEHIEYSLEALGCMADVVSKMIMETGSSMEQFNLEVIKKMMELIDKGDNENAL